MFNLLNSIIIGAAVLLASIIISEKVSTKKGTIDAYYNTQGSFAGFVQKKKWTYQSLRVFISWNYFKLFKMV
ncbi:MAG: hypothetical protein CBE11_03125 [Rickettsiales bacterium TMED251]|nr:MAG: hypothetical protein CBE11_03125 [Rickettsiales bacterium TMED251]